MALGRISGPMLLRDLERQGMDLSIDGDLIYFDVNKRRIGINTTKPNVELDIHGSASITSELYVGEKITVGNLYVLPTEAPLPGQILAATGGSVSETTWVGGFPLPLTKRRHYQKKIPTLLGYGTETFTAALGTASIVYSVKVSRPVRVEVYGTPAMNEPNPYTFVATPSHLIDDGTVILNDGSSFQSRQYSIFANLEDPPTQNVYVKVTSINNHLAGDPVDLEFFYFPAITDQGSHMDIYETDLPTIGYYGKMGMIGANNAVYIYGPIGWTKITTL